MQSAKRVRGSAGVRSTYLARELDIRKSHRSVMLLRLFVLLSKAENKSAVICELLGQVMKKDEK